MEAGPACLPVVLFCLRDRKEEEKEGKGDVSGDKLEAIAAPPPPSQRGGTMTIRSENRIEDEQEAERETGGPHWWSSS